MLKSIHLSFIFCLPSLFLFAQSLDSPSDSIEIFYQPDDVVITAQYAPTDSKSAIHQVHVIKKKDIAEKQVNNLGELLNLESNIRVSSDLILGTSLSLQGVSGQNVKIMIDGVPVIGRAGDNIDLSQILLENIERVEIIEGPLSVNYGTNALGGVINLITKKSQLNKYEVGLKSRFENPGAKTLNLWTGIRITPKLLLRLSGERFEFDGYDIEDKRNVLWNPKDKWSGEALLKYYIKDDNILAYTFSTFKEEVDNKGEIRRPQFKPYAFDDFYHTRRFSHSLFHEGTVWDQFYLKTTTAYNNFYREKNTYRHDFDTEEENLIDGEQDTLEYEAFMFRSVFASKFSRKINFQIGLDLNYETAFGQKIADSLSQKANFSTAGDYATFASLSYKPMDRLSIQAGLRGAINTRYDAPLIPSINVKYDFGRNLALRMSYAKGFRSPTLKELFYYFVDFNHYIVGNQHLKAEVSDNIQAAIAYKTKNISSSFILFYNDIQNKIDLYEYAIVNGEVVPSTGTVEYTYFNQNHFKSIGSTLRFKRQWKNLNLSFGVTGTGRFNLLSDEYTEVPPFTFLLESNAEVSYKFPKLGLNIAVFARNYDKLSQYYASLDDEGNAIVLQNIQDGYTLLDANISKSFWKEKIQLSIGAKNLLDVSSINYSSTSGSSHSGGNTGSVPISWGRSYFVSLNLRFLSK